MKKLLIAAGFLAICAAFEAPQDYEWMQHDALAALHGEHSPSYMLAEQQSGMRTPKPTSTL